MRAWWYERAGPAPEVMELGNLPEPGPAKGEVRVKVAHSAVNPTDSKRRTTGRELGRFARIVPNNDGAGVIDRVGEGVAETRLGERVWIFGAQAGRPDGTAADFLVLPSRQAIALPEGARLIDGACLGVPAVTAHRGLFADGSIAGQNVLVTGAAGRVGSYAVQLAKWAGARVVGTAGSSGKVAAVRACGADLALDYKTGDLVVAVQDFTAGAGLDRIVDCAFSETVALAPKLLRANGVIASYASDANPAPEIPFLSLMYRNIAIRPFAIFTMPRDAQDRAFADITAALAAGALQHRIGARMGFEEMSAAHAMMDGDGLWGTLVVDVGAES